MTRTFDTRSPGTAAVQLWGKGFRSSTVDSEEFQRYVPNTQADPLSFLELKLEGIQWGRVLSSLYSLSESELSIQKCVLLNEDELMSVSFGLSEDRHHRPSLIVTAASTSVDWRDASLANTASRAARLSARLANAYADTFRGSPDTVGKQLRNNDFLPSRFFDLNEESLDQDVAWGDVFTAIKKWNGIRGVSTPALLSVGANVVLGTRFEAEREQQQFRVDGYYDVRVRDIKPLSKALTPWQPTVSPPASETEPPAIPQRVADLNAVVESIDRLTAAVNRFGDIAIRLLEYKKKKW
jgi:hypothetical protein